MTVRFADAEPNGLADLVGRLIEANLEAEPERRRLLREAVIELSASDAEIQATIRFSAEGVAVSNGSAGPRPHLTIVADAFDLVARGEVEGDAQARKSQVDAVERGLAPRHGAVQGRCGCWPRWRR